MNITAQQQPARRGKLQAMGHSFKESNYVTDFWDWLVKLLSKSAELVLFGSVLYSGYEMFPGVWHPGDQINAIIFLAQQAALDIGGLGLLKIAKRAGLSRDSFPMRVGYTLVGLMICNVIMAMIKQSLPGTPAWIFATIETLLLIARSVMAVVYGHAIAELRAEHGEAEVTHNDLATLQQSITGLANSIPAPAMIDYQAIARELIPLLSPVVSEMKAAVLAELKTTEQDGTATVDHLEIARAMVPQFRRVIIEEIRTALPQIASIPQLEPGKTQQTIEDGGAMGSQSRGEDEREARLEQAYQSLLSDGKAVTGDALRELARVNKGTALAWLRDRRTKETDELEPVVLEPARA